MMEEQYYTPPLLSGETSEQMEEIPPLKPNNWLWQSIVVTLFCCVPLGIVGIVHAAKVDVLYYNGKYSEAEAVARSARNWTILAFLIGLVLILMFLRKSIHGKIMETYDIISELFQYPSG